MKVLGIYIAPSRAACMVARTETQAIPGGGFEGDRYCNPSGLRALRNVVTGAGKLRGATFIAAEHIGLANSWLQGNGHPTFTAAETRRNILLSGFTDFSSLIGEEFWCGQAKFRGVELADPCTRPSRLAGNKFGFAEAFDGRGGLRAEILIGGSIKLHSPFQF